MVSLKQKVVDAPDILTVIGKIPFLSDFLNALFTAYERMHTVG
ncbi:unnamed protein product [Calypogeia fissa]